MAVRQAHSKPSVYPLKTEPNSLCADSSVSCRSCPTPVSDARHCRHPSSHCPLHHTWIRQENKRNKHFCSCSINGGTSLGSHPSDASHIPSEHIFTLRFSAIPHQDSSECPPKLHSICWSHTLLGNGMNWEHALSALRMEGSVSEALPGPPRGSGVTASCHVPHLSVPPAPGAEMAERAQHPFLSLACPQAAAINEIPISNRLKCSSWSSPDVAQEFTASHSCQTYRYHKSEL